MKRFVLSLLVISLLSAFGLVFCSAKTQDPVLRRKAGAMRILTAEEIGDREYEILSEIKGTSCATQTGSDPSMEGARQELRIAAAELDADAIINAFCEEVGISITCWKRIECRGDAIQWASDTSA